MNADDEGDYSLAIGRYDEALTLHRSIGNKNNEGGTLNNLGYAAMALGDYETACSRFTEAQKFFGEIGNRQNEAVTLINHGIAELNLGLPKGALQKVSMALPMLRTTGARWLEAAALRLQGQAELAECRTDVARSLLGRSRDLFDGLGMNHLALEPIAALAQLEMMCASRDTALTHVETILARQASGIGLDGTEEPLRVSLICYQILHEHADDRSGAVLSAAYSALTERASRISDIQRRGYFLERVPFHRDLRLAWLRSTRPSHHAVEDAPKI
jgi:tetratricopeptide (TPR) repeat protein